VRLPDGRTMTAQIDGGSGHSGKRSPEMHFGLGRMAADRELEVNIRWRDAGGVHARTYRLLPGWHDIRLGRDA
jgi:enediyne biosynthesis protein E4